MARGRGGLPHLSGSSILGLIAALVVTAVVLRLPGLRVVANTAHRSPLPLLRVLILCSAEHSIPKRL